MTATSFNGTSSLIPLDGAWCANPAQASSLPQHRRHRPGAAERHCEQSMAVSVWFKTTAATGQILA